MAPLFDPELTDLFSAVNIHVNWPAILAAGSHMSRVRLDPAGQLTLESTLVPWFFRNGEPVCHSPERQYPGLGSVPT